MQDGAMKKAVYYAVLAGFLALVTTAAYYALARFLRDRQTVMSELNRPTVETRTRSGTQRETPAERARRVAQSGQQPGGGPAAAAAGEAAIQRQLKTLDEINRINEMNRRLQEQQRRMQNQR